MTRHVPYDEFRKDPAKYMDEAGAEPLRIDREAGSVVMIAEDEFEGWQETVHLLSSPRNAERLMRAMRELDAGKGQERELVAAEVENHPGPSHGLILLGAAFFVLVRLAAGLRRDERPRRCSCSR